MSDHHHSAQHRPTRQCPTCSGDLHLTGLACADCGTEVRGRFTRCHFCTLSDDQLELLHVFLAARGNAKELERHLNVSYPTARARLDELLTTIGIAPNPPARPSRRDVLDAVSRGELSTDEALSELSVGAD
jgi:hypothetical protein